MPNDNYNYPGKPQYDPAVGWYLSDSQPKSFHDNGHAVSFPSSGSSNFQKCNTCQTFVKPNHSCPKPGYENPKPDPTWVFKNKFLSKCSINDLMDVCITANEEGNLEDCSILVFDAAACKFVNKSITDILKGKIPTVPPTMRPNTVVVKGPDGCLYCMPIQSLPFNETVTNLVYNGDNTFTYTNEDGVDVTIDLNPYVDTDTTYVGTVAGSIITLTDSNGVQVLNFDVCAIVLTNCPATDVVTTITLNADGSFTYTNEQGATVVYSSPVTTLVPGPNAGDWTYTNEIGVPVTFNIPSAADIKAIALTCIQANEVITTLTDNGDNTFSYTNEAGTVVTIDLNPYLDNIDTDTTYSGTVAGSTITITDSDGNTVLTFDICAIVTASCPMPETVTTLVLNADGSITYTNEDGVAVSYISPVTSIVDIEDGCAKEYVNEAGVPFRIENQETTPDTLFDHSGQVVLPAFTMAPLEADRSFGTVTVTVTNPSACDDYAWEVDFAITEAGQETDGDININNSDNATDNWRPMHRLFFTEDGGAVQQHVVGFQRPFGITSNANPGVDVFNDSVTLDSEAPLQMFKEMGILAPGATKTFVFDPTADNATSDYPTLYSCVCRATLKAWRI